MRLLSPGSLSGNAENSCRRPWWAFRFSWRTVSTSLNSLVASLSRALRLPTTVEVCLPLCWLLFGPALRRRLLKKCYPPRALFALCSLEDIDSQAKEARACLPGAEKSCSSAIAAFSFWISCLTPALRAAMAWALSSKGPGGALAIWDSLKSFWEVL